MKKVTTTITSNYIGAIVGGVAVFYGAKKMGKVSNMYALIGLTVLGVYAGAYVQSMVAKKGTPTATDVKK